MEAEILAILKKIHTGVTTDSQSLEDSFIPFLQCNQQHLVSYINMQIFSEQFNLLKYLEKSLTQSENPKATEDIRKAIYNFLADYIQSKKDGIYMYIKILFDTLYQLFREEKAAKTKQCSLKPIIQLFHCIEDQDNLKQWTKPAQFHKELVNMLKVSKIVPSVRGAVWNLLGHIEKKFPTEIDFKAKQQVQKICLTQLKAAVQSDKNLSLISSILSSFSKSLHQNHLSDKELNDLFNLVKVLIVPVKATYDVNKAALGLLSQQCTLFHKLLMNSKNAQTIFDNCYGLMAARNKQLRFIALDTMTIVVQQIVTGINLDRENAENIMIFNYIGQKMWTMLEQETQKSLQKNVTTQSKNRYAGSVVFIVKILGILSPLILAIKGKDQMRKFFSKLLGICNRKMLKAFQQDRHDSGQQKANKYMQMKIVIYNQKQLASFILSFARIIQQLDQIAPHQMSHIQDLFILAIKQYPRFLDKYKPGLIQSMIRFIMGVATQDNVARLWMKKITLAGLMQSLDSKKHKVMDDKDYYKMVENATEFWNRLMTNRIWHGVELIQFSKIFFENVQHLILNLDISYKSKLQAINSNQDQDQPAAQIDDLAGVFFLADQDIQLSNLSNYQYMCSIAQVFFQIMKQIDSSLFQERIGSFYLAVAHRMKLYPKSIPLMKIIRSLNMFIIKREWLSTFKNKINQEVILCMCGLFKDINEQVFKFQEQYFYQGLKLLLSMPNPIYLANSCQILKYDLERILLKSLDLGQQIISLAFSAINCLQSLFRIQKGKAQLYLSKVVPHLQQYITNKNKIDQQQFKSYLLISEITMTRQQAVEKVMKFLGEIGGLSHLFVDNQNNNHVSWDYQSKIYFPITMAGESYDINLSKLLGRTCWLMVNGKDQLKCYACQFMHTTVVYILGKAGTSALRSKDQMAHIFDKILPTLLQVAANTSHPSQQLIHTLVIQTIHFLANTNEPNSPDIQILLQHVLDLYKGAEDLSFFASKCLSQLVKYHIKQAQRKSTFPLVKTTFRNIWSMVPNKKARQGLIDLLTKLLKILHRQENLMATYALQFCSLIIALSRTDKQSEPSLQYLVRKYILALKPYIKRLVIQQDVRKFRKYETLQKLLEWIYFNSLFSHFTQQRQVSFIIWQSILQNYGVYFDMDVKNFLYNKSNREKKYLFNHLKPVIIRVQEPYLNLMIPKISAQSEMWAKLAQRQFLEAKNIIRFGDFNDIYMKSFASLIKYLSETLRKLDVSSRILHEDVQKNLITCFYSFFKLVHQFGQARNEIFTLLKLHLKSQQILNVINFLVVFIFSPSKIIPNFNMDLLQKYQNFCSYVLFFLQTILEQNLLKQINRIFKDIFNCEWVKILDHLFLKDTLFEREINNILQVLTVLNKITQDVSGFAIDKLLGQGIVILAEPNLELTSQKKAMILGFLLQHSDRQSILKYVLDNVQMKSLIYEKNEKIWIKNIVKNWSLLGQGIVKIAVSDPKNLALLFSLSKLLQGEDLHRLFHFVQKMIRYDGEAYIQDCLKIHFILLEYEKQLDMEYRIHLCGLIISALDISASLRIHEQAMYLAASLLKKQPQLQQFRKNIRYKLNQLSGKYIAGGISRLKNSQQKSNCVSYMRALKNAIIISKQFHLVDFLYETFKDDKIQPYYAKIVQEVVDDCLKVAFGKQKIQQQKLSIDFLFSKFWNKAYDSDCWSNFRVITVERFLCKALQICPTELTAQLFLEVAEKLIQILKQPAMGSFNDTVLKLQLKKAAFMLLESFYNNIPRKDRDTHNVHQKQLHKQIIKICLETVKIKFRNIQELKDFDDREKSQKKSMNIFRSYVCASYNCLISIFISTQSNKEHFKSFIFENNKEILWENLIDPAQKDFDFQIETNFQIMTPYKENTKTINKTIKEKYWQSSLYAIEQQFVPHSGQGLEPIQQQANEQDQKAYNRAEQEKKKLQQKKQEEIPLQLDSINRHPCMINLLRVIDHLYYTFYDGSIPSWMGPIYDELNKENCPLSVKIFLIKLILNRPKIFTQQMWAKPLFAYLSLTDNGGKFIHYFFRDVARQVCWYIKEKNFNPSGKQLTPVIMKIIKSLPHENNQIYSDNIVLMQSFFTCTQAVVQKSTIIKMIKASDPKSNNKYDWRMCALIVLKSCIIKKVPIIDTTLQSGQKKNMSLIFEIRKLGLLPLVYEMITDSLKRYRTAAAGFLGQLLKTTFEAQISNQQKKDLFEELARFVCSINNKSNRSAQQKFPSTVLQISQRFPQILQDSVLFEQLQTGLVQNKKQRSQILYCFIKYVQYVDKNRSLGSGNIPRIMMTIRGYHTKILSEDLEFHLTFIRLLFECSKHIFLLDKEILETYYYIYDEISRVYSESKDQQCSLSYYKMLIRIYDFLNDPDIPKTDKNIDFKKIIKRGLIKGLGSQFQLVKKTVFEVFENLNKDYDHTATRLIEIFHQIYDYDSEQLWLVNIVPLIFTLAKKSSDYTRLLFGTSSLNQLAQFYDWDFRSNFKFQNASQPYTPIFTQGPATLAKKQLNSISQSIGGDRIAGAIRATQNQYLSQQQQVFTMLASQSEDNPSLAMGSLESQKNDSGQSTEDVNSRINQIFQNKKKKRNKTMDSFKETNYDIFQTDSYSFVDNKIRFRKNVDKTFSKTKKANKPKQTKNNLLRKYKIGQLPDIRITSKDMLDPMISIASLDHDFASELFIIIFTNVCKSSNHDKRKNFKDIICDLLSHSRKHEYNFISTLEKSLISLCQNGQKIDFSMKNLAFLSNTFDYAIVFTQQNIIQTIRDPDIHNQEQWIKTVNNQWGDLIDLYQHLNEQDLIFGILLKVVEGDAKESLINSLQLKKNGKIAESKEILQKIIDKSNSDSIKRFLQRQKIDCQTLLGNWESVTQDILIKTEKHNHKLTHQEQKLLEISMLNLSQEEALAINKKIQIQKMFDQYKSNYQLAITNLFSTHNVDKAKYHSIKAMKVFSDQWSRVSSFAFHSKHDLLQTIQKTFQLQEFLSIYSSNKKQNMQKQCMELFNNWSHRQPNYMHDTNITWIQILESRIMFANLLANKIGISQKDIAKANTDWLIQVTNGMVLKGALGGAQHLIRKALKCKKNYQKFIWQFYDSIAKLKLKQLILEKRTEFKSYGVVPNLIEKQMKKESNVGQFNKLKLSLVTNQFYQGYLSSCLSRPQQIQPFQFAEKVQSIYQNYENINNSFKSLNKSIDQSQIQTLNDFKTKLYFSFTNYLERILGIIKGKFEIKTIKSLLEKKNFTSQNLSKVFFQNLIKSIQFSNFSKQGGMINQSENENLFSLIMKLLKIVQSNHEFVGKYFTQAILDKKIPIWIFIYFIPQIIKLLNSFELSHHFEDLFECILYQYPEALVYHFNCSYGKPRLCLTNISKRIYKLIHQKMPIHFKFIENIQLLHHPQLRLKQILERIRMPDEAQNVIEDLQQLLINQQNMGKYNKKFFSDWESRIRKTIAQKKNNQFTDKDYQLLVTNLQDKNEKFKMGFTKISDASTFFQQYNSSDDNRIEVPGTIYKNFEQPVAWRRVYIQSFDHSVLTLASIRKPKRITIFGSNQKKYMLLVKGGQDIRLDQRIQQLFGVINRILKNNCNSSKKQLQIKRFQVVPMKKLLGIFEWVDQSQTLRQFLQTQLKQRDPKLNLKDKNKAFELRKQLLDEVAPQYKQDRNVQHKILLNANSKLVVQKFKACQREIPYGLLRKALERLSKNYDSYLHIKNRFICNYAVSCLVSYILGIGDRHLENFLIHSKSASVVLIDFGYSFGASIDLKVPQLVPFRLTKVFKQLTDPIGFDGLFKKSLLACYDALSQKVPVIVDFCEIFIDDPLVEWVWISKKKMSASNQQIKSLPQNISFSVSQQPPEKIFFSKKIEYVQRKLMGQNPRKVLDQALTDSGKHTSTLYIATLKKAIWDGDTTKKKQKLSSIQYIEALISLATDKNILGRAYTGWAPYI